MTLKAWVKLWKKDLRKLLDYIPCVLCANVDHEEENNKQI